MVLKHILLALGTLGLLAQPACSAAGAPDETESTASHGPSTGAGHSTGSNGGFINLAPPLQEPLDPNQGTPVDPPPPPGWNWYQIDQTACRDGSPAGIYVHFAPSDKLVIYLEGGGACSSPGFCNFNPANVNQVISGGESALGSMVVAGRQQPATTGIFAMTNPANPFMGWNMVYIPYCTGDVHFGVKTNVTVPGSNLPPQQFIGHLNLRQFISHIAPTFPFVSQVVLTGASAGGFASLLNFSMIQDTFGTIPVIALADSSPPFSDEFMTPCLQMGWRNLFGYSEAIPPDCAECFQADGGGLAPGLASFLLKKHPTSRVGLISSMQDEVIRLFFAAGLNSCSNNDPVTLLVLGMYPGPQFEQGLMDVRARYLGAPIATYYLAGMNLTLHQHIWRDRFYTSAAGGITIADWTRDFIAGHLSHVGP
jgi:hypothetical protein